ncbi:phosphotransferase [Corynebacterium felinum]|uniref:Aminoglycoside phosphotransferase domain-containing protein n=1 Tax=Corynebacterium felinum TaxID=131318 RepID=A0ABU2BCA1_9CORY|nr:phosphotransferase [Corynebacterium felinum]MDF5820670.1 phosphotransferase [Corynebacterium felinum]MDR7356267.1 hypothetical protein [Corynebacterium felinum]WJY95599.1 Phosphotransferase enzyme family protein [Corynebacterium felinum]
MTNTTATYIDHLTDPNWLYDHLGSHVTAEWIRIKPDTSLIASITDATTGITVGWLRLLWPKSHIKATKLQRIAHKAQMNVRTQQLSENIILQTGDVISDPKLFTHLRLLPEEVTTGTLLRYNPARRVIFRVGDQVWRVSRKSVPSPKVHELMSAVVPMQARVDDGSNPHVSVMEFVGDTDLARSPDVGAVARVGGLLARLHGARSLVDGGCAVKRRDVRRQLKAHVRILSAVDPSLAAAAAGLDVPEYEDSREVVVHGDFTPDQVLCDHRHEKVWLSDFDRVHLGPAASDLGSFVSALNPSHQDAFLCGYAQVAPLPSDADIRCAQVHAQLLRLMEPVRAGSPTWRDDIAARIAQVGQVG